MEKRARSCTLGGNVNLSSHYGRQYAAAAAAKSPQSCLTLCDPIDGSPPGSAIPGIRQGRTLAGCHFLLQCMKVKSESEVAQSCPTLCDPMDCSLPGSSAHGIFQARVLELGKTVWRFLKNLGIKPQYDPAIPILGIYTLRKPKLKKTHVFHCSLQHYLQYLEHGSNLDVHQKMNGKRSCGTYTQWNITQPYKGTHLSQF